MGKCIRCDVIGCEVIEDQSHPVDGIEQTPKGWAKGMFNDNFFYLCPKHLPKINFRSRKAVKY